MTAESAVQTHDGAEEVSVVRQQMGAQQLIIQELVTQVTAITRTL